MEDSRPTTPQPAGFDLSEPQTRFIALFGIVTLILLIAIILALQAYFNRVKEREVFVKVLEPVSADLLALHAREDLALNSYRYIARAKGTVHLPIRRAMGLLIAESAEGKSFYPTKPVPVPAPAAAVPVSAAKESVR